MGCDIHLYVEKREGERWVSADIWYDNPDKPGRKTVYSSGSALEVLAGPFYRSRNYDLFAILANVRNGAGIRRLHPIAAPRGVPGDASPEYRMEVEDWGEDGHSHSYFTVAELIAYDWTQTTTLWGWVNAKEFTRFQLTGRPESWNVALPPKLEGKYTRISWQVAYYESAREFLAETMPKLWRLGRPEDVRIVFFFDN